MRTFGCSLAVAVSLWIAGISRAEAQSSKVRLTTDKPVYTAKGTDLVKIFLTNEGTQPVQLSHPSPWTVWQGSKLVHTHVAPQVLVTLDPGKSMGWYWNKKNTQGKKVAFGTYTIRVGAIYGATAAYDLKQDVALTPSGKIAGTSPFPLAVGNEWTYSTANGVLRTTKVAQKVAKWYLVQDVIGKNRWCGLTGSAQPHFLVVEAPKPAETIYSYFQFHRPVGTTFKITLDWQIVTLSVVANDETVVTPAGTFPKCYRIAFQYNPAAMIESGFGSFAFAPGIGIVQYSTWGVPFSTSGYTTYSLHQAKIRGVDGKVYLIGPKG